MRLLNTFTFDLEEFFEPDIPKYAILSHRWINGQEIFYEELSQSQIESSDQLKKSGWRKIRWFANLAKQSYDCNWCWADTCCIDKKSSSELSEAINSMYNWYKRSEVCVAYLCDVDALKDDILDFPNSVWFRRGWTLQELLAPSKVDFYQNDYIFLGSKKTLALEIAQVTGISVDFLLGEASIDLASIATRMSWASKRETTRVEDVAYSLLGIFEVNMPLLYGEGSKAFQRLQYEIISQSGDESIFAWTASTTRLSSRSLYHNMLVDSPKAFSKSARVNSLEGRFFPRPDSVHRPPYAATNKGLAISVPVRMPFLPSADERLRIAITQLDCHFEVDGSSPTSPRFHWIYMLLARDARGWVRIELPFHITSHKSEYDAKKRPPLQTIRIRSTTNLQFHASDAVLRAVERVRKQYDDFVPVEVLSECISQNGPRATDMSQWITGFAIGV